MDIACKDLPSIGGEHGVSSVYATLDDIISFKEGSLKVTRGYPRFVMHPYLDALARITAPGCDYRWVLSSIEGARFLRDEFSPTLDIEIIERSGCAVVAVSSAKKFAILYEDVRNTGFTLSSRRAKRILCGVNDPEKGSIELCAAAISQLEKGSVPEHTYLFSSGMGALFAALYSAFREEKPGAIIVGNPYVDSIQLFSKYLTRKGFSAPKVVSDALAFEKTLDDATGIVYLEVPTNPLLRVADLERIVSAAHARGIVVLVDSTIASPFNISPFEFGADLIMHSTTKFLNGHNDHMGGVLLINPSSQLVSPARVRDFVHRTGSVLDPEEGKILLSHLDGFESRMEIINRNTLLVARYLSSHPAIEHVYYPLLESHPDFDLARKYLVRGASGVVSFTLSESSLECARLFYDNCTIPGKGPSLGAEETLLCPITLLTYFFADDAMLQAMGLDRYLMRLSVGVEDPYVIIAQLEAGLRAIRKEIGPV
ncbi:MAG TPA: PLP-dependent aspartate aminotransferase family protein [Spirochaetota bacterium]